MLLIILGLSVIGFIVFVPLEIKRKKHSRLYGKLAYVSLAIALTSIALSVPCLIFISGGTYFDSAIAYYQSQNKEIEEKVDIELQQPQLSLKNDKLSETRMVFDYIDNLDKIESLKKDKRKASIYKFILYLGK